MNSKKNIVLIGMPAVGKSTVGVLLAKRLGFSFVDTDIVIQAAEGRTLQEIIEADGLEHFMAVEENRVKALSCKSHVIATGGSVVYSEKAMASLASGGTIIYLDLGMESLKQRLKDIRSRGVVMEPKETIEGLYERRRPLYNRWASLTVNCSDLTPGDVVEKIMKQLAAA